MSLITFMALATAALAIRRYLEAVSGRMPCRERARPD